jgi:hypothetical protein
VLTAAEGGALGQGVAYVSSSVSFLHLRLLFRCKTLCTKIWTQIVIFLYSEHLIHYLYVCTCEFLHRRESFDVIPYDTHISTMGVLQSRKEIPEFPWSLCETCIFMFSSLSVSDWSDQCVWPVRPVLLSLWTLVCNISLVSSLDLREYCNVCYWMFIQAWVLYVIHVQCNLLCFIIFIIMYCIWLSEEAWIDCVVFDKVNKSVKPVWVCRKQVRQIGCENLSDWYLCWFLSYGSRILLHTYFAPHELRNIGGVPWFILNMWKWHI